MHSLSAPRSLRIVVVTTASRSTACEGAAPARARRDAALHSGLLASGCELVASLAADVSLPERIAQIRPDLIVVDCESDAREVLAHIASATREAPRPIVLFTEDGAPASMDAALAAGVSAYIVAGLQAERVKPVLDLALARFRRERELLDELSDTRRRLAERKLVEKAKGVLMARQGLTEDEAYRKLRGMAMDRKLTLGDLARRVLDAADFL